MRLALLILLSACTYEPQDSKRITIISVSNPIQVAEKCSDQGILGEDFGCAKGSGTMPQGQGDSCPIVIIPPKSFDDHAALETLGHEVWHCFKGPKHT